MGFYMSIWQINVITLLTNLIFADLTQKLRMAVGGKKF